MVYLKCTIAGVLALVLSAFVTVVLLFFVYKPFGTRAVAFDFSSLLRWPLLWILMLLIFGAGFYWEFRRL